MNSTKKKIGVFVASVVTATALYLIPKFETDEEADQRHLREIEFRLAEIGARFRPDISMSVNEAKNLMDEEGRLTARRDKIQRKLGI